MAVLALRDRSCNLFRAGGGHTNDLQYRDVMVITEDGTGLHDDVRDRKGQVTSPASGFVRGLREPWGLQDAKMPVCVLEGIGRVVDRAGWERRVADVAVSRTDCVTVAEWRCVQGLERRVVVWLTDWRRGRVMEFRKSDHFYALPALSRCTTQLIRVLPRYP